MKLISRKNNCKNIFTLPTKSSADPTTGIEPCFRSPGLLGTERDMPAAPFVSPLAKKYTKIVIKIESRIQNDDEY